MKTKMSLSSKIVWVFNIITYTYCIINFDNFLQGLSAINKFWKERCVSMDINIDNAIISNSYPYEYCKLEENVTYSDATLYDAGTPMPSMPVVINTPMPSMPVVINTPMPSMPVPTIIEDTQVFPTLTVSLPDNYIESNFHIVVVGAGFSDSMEYFQLMNIVEKAYSNINIDFAYINETVDLEFARIAQMAMFENDDQRKELIQSVEAVYPEADAVVVIVNTNDWIGTSWLGFTIQKLDYYPIVHEIGHQVGMDDGYVDFYDPSNLVHKLPNNELFFKDEMPMSLKKAINELGYIPPIYLMGTCNGRNVYSFYETENNVYGEYSPNGNPSWGNGPFTPLQVIIMNNYIESIK